MGERERGRESGREREREGEREKERGREGEQEREGESEGGRGRAGEREREGGRAGERGRPGEGGRAGERGRERGRPGDGEERHAAGDFGCSLIGAQVIHHPSPSLSSPSCRIRRILHHGEALRQKPFTWNILFENTGRKCKRSASLEFQRFLALSLKRSRTRLWVLVLSSEAGFGRLCDNRRQDELLNFDNIFRFLTFPTGRVLPSHVQYYIGSQ